MVVGIIIALFGLGAITLGALQISGALPTTRRGGGLGNISGYVNIAVGVLLIALGVLRVKGLV